VSPLVPPLEQPSEGAFEERVYSSVIGTDPEWEVEGTLRGYDPLPRLHEIRAPTLVLSGRYDRLTPPSVAQAIFNALARSVGGSRSSSGAHTGRGPSSRTSTSPSSPGSCSRPTERGRLGYSAVGVCGSARYVT
jgi:hypothetical protein